MAFWPPKDFIHRLALPFVSGPLASLSLNITTVHVRTCTNNFFFLGGGGGGGGAKFGCCNAALPGHVT